jgi:1-acyl-sn-glycerol-3-phosphate acyltransferase
MNFFLVLWTRILGTRYTLSGSTRLPKNKAVIIVANHQSLYDIPFIIWKLRSLHPKFVAKKELGKGIPSVSYNLKYGGSVLIDRKSPDQSLKAIASLGAYIEKHHRAAVIFPEGTRSKDGQPRKFKRGGLKILMDNSPNAVILPISISNSWKMHRWGAFPNGIGVHLKFYLHPPIENSGDSEKIIDKVEQLIKSGIQNNG